MSGQPSLPPISLCFPMSKPFLITGIIAWDILLSLFISTWFQITSSILCLPYRPHFIVKIVISIKVISYLFLNPHLFPPLLCKLSSLMYRPLLFRRLTISTTTSFLLTTSPTIYGSTRSKASQMSVWFFPDSKPLLRISLNRKSLHSTWIMEMNTLDCLPLLATHGIPHHTSPPHTP